ncbi:Protein of unknown function [Pyronema omphalodes CBS 100304]|uniref:Uncharacterized protein n=1 Tax=Pyronema omphalodes (strain CBS 100304) TaxID=1076935 RepID=U4KYR6_PYROM|nr:Protein of unknown function [Pyronema omphalodes CBS 100304]
MLMITLLPFFTTVIFVYFAGKVIMCHFRGRSYRYQPMLMVQLSLILSMMTLSGLLMVGMTTWPFRLNTPRDIFNHYEKISIAQHAMEFACGISLILQCPLLLSDGALRNIYNRILVIGKGASIVFLSLFLKIVVRHFICHHPEPGDNPMFAHSTMMNQPIERGIFSDDLDSRCYPHQGHGYRWSRAGILLLEFLGLTILALTTRPRCWKVREFIGTMFTLFSLGFCYIFFDVAASGVKFWLYRDWIPIEAGYVPDLLHVWQSLIIVFVMCVPFVFHDAMPHIWVLYYLTFLERPLRPLFRRIPAGWPKGVCFPRIAAYFDKLIRLWFARKTTTIKQWCLAIFGRSVRKQVDIELENAVPRRRAPRPFVFDPWGDLGPSPVRDEDGYIARSARDCFDSLFSGNGTTSSFNGTARDSGYTAGTTQNTSRNESTTELSNEMRNEPGIGLGISTTSSSRPASRAENRVSRGPAFINFDSLASVCSEDGLSFRSPVAPRRTAVRESRAFSDPVRVGRGDLILGSGIYQGDRGYRVSVSSGGRNEEEEAVYEEDPGHWGNWGVVVTTTITIEAIGDMGIEKVVSEANTV